jgi:limonene-1,2-epoxide hydrolase
MSQEACHAIMLTYLEEVLGQRRFDLIPGIVADDLIDHTQPHLRGSEALVAHARGFCDNTPDLRIEVLRIIATDETALGIWRWYGEPKYPSAVSNSGAPVIPRLIASLFDISNGRITQYRAFVDAMDVFTQLAR